MADIQSATAEIRRGKKKRKKKEEEKTTGEKYNGRPYSIGQRAARSTFQTCILNLH